ncbi:TolC family protein [Marinifilum sp.]|uniref:TolC family protein n=1 Tax=Marinifilum sp. TaxID=2033137 RepID=UPI003BAB9C0E
MRKIISLFICFLIVSEISKLLAQQTEMKLSLQEALQTATDNNRQINKAKEQGRVAKAEFRQTNSVFLPKLNLSHTAVATNDPLASFGFKLKQKITTSKDFNPILLNDPDRIENYNTKITVQQPILNFDGFYLRKAANTKMQAVDFTTARAINFTKFEVKKAYYQLELAQEAVDVIAKSVETAKSALRQTKHNLEQGYAKEADLLSAKVHLLEVNNQLEDAKNSQRQAGEWLAYILGLDIQTTIVTTDKLNHVPSLLQALSESDEGMRSDIMAYKKSLESHENMLKSEKMRFLPRLNAFGAYGWNDSKLFGTSANNYMLGASLSWDIFTGYKHAGKVQKAEAELKIAKFDLTDYQSRSNMEIIAAKRNLKLTFNRIETNKLAKEQAEEAFRIRTNRYKQGLEKTIDVLHAESMALMKKLDYINSLYNYHVAVFQLELLLEKVLQ